MRKKYVNKQVRHKRGLKHETKCLMQNWNKKYMQAQERLRNIFRKREKQKLYEEIISSAIPYSVRRVHNASVKTSVFQPTSLYNIVILYL